MTTSLFDVNISDVADSVSDVPGFAIMLSNPAAPDDTYYQSESLGIFSQNHANIVAGYSDMQPTPSACFHGMSTAWYGFLGTRQDGGTAITEGGYIVGTSEYFSGAGGFGYGTFDAYCDDPNGPFAEYRKGPFGTPSATGTIILGGNRCQAKMVSFDLNATTGDQSITGVGFQPEAVIFLGCMNAADGVTVDGTNFMMGAAGADRVSGAPTNQWTGATRSQFFSSSPLQRYSVWYPNNCISHIGASSFSGITTFNQLASYVSSDADGFTINLSAAQFDSAGTPMSVRALCLRTIDGSSGSIEVGNGLQGDGSITTAVEPQVMMFCSTQAPADGVTRAIDCYAALGAVERNSGMERSFWEGTQTGSSPLPNNWAYTSTLSSIRWADYNQNLLAEANVTLGGTTQSLNWTTDGGQGYGFGWIAFTVATTNHEPFPVTMPATGITLTQANLNGMVTPDSELGVIVSYYFEWGISMFYGNTTPGGTVGSGFTPINVSETVLIPVPIGTHYRIVAVDQFGCLYYGGDMVIEEKTGWRSIRYE